MRCMCISVFVFNFIFLFSLLSGSLPHLLQQQQKKKRKKLLETITISDYVVAFDWHTFHALFYFNKLQTLVIDVCAPHVCVRCLSLSK